MPREREDNEDHGERKDLLSDWITVRNSCPEERIYRTDAEYAEELGLPTLAAICDVLDRLTKARGRIDPKEIESVLRPVLSLARGEARERLRIAYNNDSIEIPGVPTIPRVLLEREVLRNRELEQEDRAQGLAL